MLQGDSLGKKYVHCSHKLPSSLHVDTTAIAQQQELLIKCPVIVSEGSDVPVLGHTSCNGASGAVVTFSIFTISRLGQMEVAFCEECSSGTELYTYF